jgi:hypothetical protein
MTDEHPETEECIMEVNENRDSRPDEMAYSLDQESLPVYVGKGLGDMYYKDAVELSSIKRATLGLPADLEFISQVAPCIDKPKKDSQFPHAPRASKNNPYFCPYCVYQSTRRGNMKKHLGKIHDDFKTEPHRF